MASRQGAEKLTFTNLEQLEALVAPPILSEKVYGYYRSGSDSEATVRFNREAFTSIKLLPRVLVDVSTLDTTTTLLGRKLAFPLLIAPMAMQRMAHTDGELAVARAAAKAGIPMVQSTMGTVRMDRVLEAAQGAPLMMFQLYVIRDRDFTRNLIQEAEKLGYAALVVTVDAPRLGNREADVKNRFEMPEGMQLENLKGLAGRRNSTCKAETSSSQIAGTFVSYIDPSLTWEFVSWLRSVTKLPIFVKGILAPNDAQRAVDVGVDGIVVSNHGGRQVDFAPGALEVLPSIAKVVGGRVPILMDGGVRRGTDIIKALALGANAVLVGRPVLYGLALGGEQGVQQVLDILKREFRLSLGLMGCSNVHQLNSSMLMAPQQTQSML